MPLTPNKEHVCRVRKRKKQGVGKPGRPKGRKNKGARRPKGSGTVLKGGKVRKSTKQHRKGKLGRPRKHPCSK